MMTVEELNEMLAQSNGTDQKILKELEEVQENIDKRIAEDLEKEIAYDRAMKGI